MNVKEIAAYVAALEAILEAVPGLVDERHIEKTKQLRQLLTLLLRVN